MMEGNLVVTRETKTFHFDFDLYHIEFSIKRDESLAAHKIES